MAISDSSAQPCGCDKGANYTCKRHTDEAQICGWFVDEQGRTRHEPLYVKPDMTAAERKTYPLATGCLDYFPDALMYVAHVSFVGNEQHNPGQPLHWDRAKSKDEADACMRHLKDRGTFDSDGVRHSGKAAWRALALLQKELEGEKV